MYKKDRVIDKESLLVGLFRGATTLKYGANRIVFSQGEPADSVFFLLWGKVKLTVTSPQGKEVIASILESGFFGEGCLANQPLRVATARTMTDCTLARMEKTRMDRMLHEQHNTLEMFVTQLLFRAIKYEADLIELAFDSSKKRLARILLQLAHFEKDSHTGTIVVRVNQENLAQSIGITRSRIRHYLKKFMDSGFIDYSANGWLTVHSSLLKVVLAD